MYTDRFARDGIRATVVRLPKEASKRWRVFQQARAYDAVLLHKKTLTAVDAILLRRFARRIIYDFDDAIMVSADHPQRDWSSRRARFRRTVRLADAVIAGNEYLAGQAKRYGAEVRVIPTGLDTGMYEGKLSSRPDGATRLVWIGSSSTLKYLEILLPVLEDIGRRHSNVVLRIICDCFAELSHMKVEACLWSQHDHVEQLLSSDIGLAPLPDDRFTRGKCGFKILQYAAAGLPTIGSPVGVNTEFIGPERRGLLAETPEQWADAIERLLGDVDLRRQMGEAARQFCQSFDSSVVGQKLVSVLHQVVGESAC